MRDNMTSVLWVFLICSAITCILTSFSACQARASEAAEKTKQEAIKAGLIQGEYGRWRKP